MAGQKGVSPVRFSQKMFDTICNKIADGMSVREACRGKGMPNRWAFNQWRKRTPELQAQYDAANKDHEDAAFDDILYIADTVRDPKVAKVRMDARIWSLSKRNFGKYGNKLANEHTGKDGGAIIVAATSLDEKL